MTTTDSPNECRDEIERVAKAIMEADYKYFPRLNSKQNDLTLGERFTEIAKVAIVAMNNRTPSADYAGLIEEIICLSPDADAGLVNVGHVIEIIRAHKEKHDGK